MNRKDQLEMMAKECVEACLADEVCLSDEECNRVLDHVLTTLVQVEREALEQVQNKIETELEKEHESTDDQIWEIRDWCKQQAEVLK